MLQIVSNMICLHVFPVLTVCQGLKALHALHWNRCYRLLLAVGCQQHQLQVTVAAFK